MSGTCEVTDKTVSALSALPILAFVGSADTIVKPENSMQILDAVKAAGGEVEIKVFEGADHFSVPELAFLDEELDVIGWLIRHKKQTALMDYDGQDTYRAHANSGYICVSFRILCRKRRFNRHKGI